MDFQAYRDEKKKLIDEALDKYLPPESEPPEIIHRAMRSALFPGGKRLRPMLTLSAAEIVGSDSQKVLPTACALELIHTYSLIHDDLPALDNDDERRGRPSCHKAFGEDIAVLAGDALLTLAFDLLSRNGQVEGVKKEEALSIIEEITRAIGTRGMIGGQVDDLKLEDITQPQLESIHRRKTGALMEVCLKAGAVLGGGKPREIEALSRYGQSIGLAFQIVDDILDADDAEKDAAGGKGKTSYPAIFGLEKSKQKATELIKEAKAQLSIFGKKGKVLEEIAGLIMDRGSKYEGEVG
ncbi:polyprenyl synthetase family protein [bacterium]|nr:polyprenyl synthetase family protein [bacterium]